MNEPLYFGSFVEGERMVALRTVNPLDSSGVQKWIYLLAGTLDISEGLRTGECCIVIECVVA